MGREFWRFSSNQASELFVISRYSLKIEGLSISSLSHERSKQVNGPTLSSHRARGQGWGTPALG